MKVTNNTTERELLVRIALLGGEFEELAVITHPLAGLMLQMSLVGLGVVICDWTKLVMAACSQRLGVPIAVDANGSARERDSCWLEKWSFHNVLSWIRQHL
ncbi:hypothetical protein ACOSQ4_009067 [Xanthoceras sorbifolium]